MSARVELDANGDGVIDFVGSTLEGVPYTFSAPGVYIATVTVTDTAGNRTIGRTIAHVLDRAAIDSVLKAKWNSMKAALVAGDVETALTFFGTVQQPRYRTIFNALGAQVSSIASQMQDIELIYVRDVVAKYRIRRSQMYGGQPMTLTYYIYFFQGTTGGWAIDS